MKALHISESLGNCVLAVLHALSVLGFVSIITKIQ